MSANPFFKLFALATGLLLAVYGCQDKEPALKAPAAVGTTAALLAELASVTTQAGAEAAIVHFWHGVYRAHWGAAYPEKEYEQKIIANHRIGRLATAHLNYLTGKATPTQTLGAVLQAYAARRQGLNVPRIAPPARVIAALQKQVNAAFRRPEAPGSFLPVLIAAAGKNPSQAPAVEATMVLSPMQQLALLLWLSEEPQVWATTPREESAEDWGQWEYGLRYTDEEIAECTRAVDALRETPDVEDECDCRMQITEAEGYCNENAIGSQEYTDCMNEQSLQDLKSTCNSCEEAREQRKINRHRAIGECLEDRYGPRTEGAADQG
jgi:hypothetical protein